MAYLLLFHRNMARIFLALTPEKDLNDQIIELKKQKLIGRIALCLWNLNRKLIGKRMMITT